MRFTFTCLVLALTLASTRAASDRSDDLGHDPLGRPRFAIGDLVRILDDPSNPLRIGSQATIKSDLGITEHSDERVYTVQFNKTETKNFEVKYLTPWTDEENNPKFNKGDRVRIVNDPWNASRAGQTGVILQLVTAEDIGADPLTTKTNLWYVRYEDDSGAKVYCPEHLAKLVDPSALQKLREWEEEQKKKEDEKKKAMAAAEAQKRKRKQDRRLADERQRLKAINAEVDRKKHMKMQEKATQQAKDWFWRIAARRNVDPKTCCLVSIPPLEVGDRVILKDLCRPEFNGEKGVVTGYQDKEDPRWVVKLRDGKNRSFRRKNLILRSVPRPCAPVFMDLCKDICGKKANFTFKSIPLAYKKTSFKIHPNGAIFQKATEKEKCMMAAKFDVLNKYKEQLEEWGLYQNNQCAKSSQNLCGKFQTPCDKSSPKRRTHNTKPKNSQPKLQVGQSVRARRRGTGRTFTLGLVMRVSPDGTTVTIRFDDGEIQEGLNVEEFRITFVDVPLE